MTLEKTAVGAFSLANPALITLDPLSITIGVRSTLSDMIHYLSDVNTSCFNHTNSRNGFKALSFDDDCS